MEAGKSRESHSQTLTGDDNAASASMEGCLMEDCSDNSPEYVCDKATQAATHEQKERSFDGGPIQTGTAHPTRDSISRPYAPVPNTSNANKDTNRHVSGKESQIPEMIDNPLHQQINSASMMQKPERII
ncbi:hypothetical protein BDV26DRAFT_286976 [Aspergillus bertholletiae]|uniref:Uncharacterized protein n=1 Tax=Aspergillus bertholletiae TaxID=1226010 RepID=A0A5N7AMW3_9EURO|nr:hypothetical protein BDV26DRAFT_286976 [Aspergillus bertholletiae]